MRTISQKTLFIMIYDICVVMASFYLAVSIRYGDMFPPPFQDVFKTTKIFLAVAIIQFLSFYFMNVYRAMIRFSSIPDLVRILRGTLLAVPTSFLALFLMDRVESIPRSSFFIDWFLLIIGLCAGRLAYRVHRDNAVQQVKKSNFSLTQRVLIIGAGAAGEKLLREIQSNPQIHLHIIGFVDDDKKKFGKSIRGVPIHGPLSELKSVIKKLAINRVLLAIPSASNDEVKNIVSFCLEASVKVKILPKMSDIIDGVITYSKLRNVEPGDLLGRKAHDLDIHNMSKLLHNKVILVTGAGGSIGSELCKQIARFEPKLLILFEMTELFLYELEKMLKEELPDLNIKPIIGDVRNINKLKDVFKTFNPEIVFHAAAYKHVPLMEHNPIEAIRTNVLGTLNVARLSSEFKAQKFVLVSTDKAINPTNIMGASKRIAELLCQDLQQISPTQFITVRFGNVLGSSGSVVPAFTKQIERGGPVQVTHPEMRRYFMSIPEATQLVIQAGALGEGGEIMVLDMGESMRIVDLAKEMIKLAGLEPGRDIEIEFTGLRPGEKLFEELFHEGDNIKETKHPMVKIATTNPPAQNFEQLLTYLLGLPEQVEIEEIKTAIKNIVPEYNYQQKPETLSLN